jgi:histidinol-phosphate aminotransferase
MNDTLSLFNRIVPPYVQQITAYIPSKPDDILMKVYNAPFLYRLNNNENALGPPPGAIEAISGFNPFMAARYPSGDSYHLRHRLSELTSLPSCSFIIGNGANEVINFVIKSFCSPGDNIITADKTFAVYEWVAEFSGCEARLVPLKEYAFDDDAILAARDEKTKVIFICNPNNPTGTYWSRDKLCRFLDLVDGEQIVVLDEAYAEYVTAPDYPSGITLISKYPNLVVFRTFSKMFGLAGLRIGYLAGDRTVTDVIRKTTIAYSVNILAMAGALGALADDGSHIKNSHVMVRNSREYMKNELERLKLPYICGEGNFMMIQVPISDTLLYRRLMQRGYMVRTMTGFRFPNYIRVTFHEVPVMEGFIAALKDSVFQGKWSG